MLSAVIFDLFETSVTEYDPCYVPGRSVAARLGVSESEFKRGWRERHAARMTGQQDYSQVLREICARAGIRPSETQIELLCQERRQLKAQPLRDVDPTILDLLDSLREEGLKLGVISNAAADEVAQWPYSALAPRIDGVVFSYQVGFVKPHPRIYALACERLQVQPNQAAFVGDGRSSELAGAAAAGLRSFWATWFLDRWPEGVRREDPAVLGAEQYPRTRSTLELESLLRGVV